MQTEWQSLETVITGHLHITRNSKSPHIFHDLGCHVRIPQVYPTHRPWKWTKATKVFTATQHEGHSPQHLHHHDHGDRGPPPTTVMRRHHTHRSWHLLHEQERAIPAPNRQKVCGAEAPTLLFEGERFGVKHHIATCYPLLAIQQVHRQPLALEEFCVEVLVCSVKALLRKKSVCLLIVGRIRPSLFCLVHVVSFDI